MSIVTFEESPKWQIKVCIVNDIEPILRDFWDILLLQYNWDVIHSISWALSDYFFSTYATDEAWHFFAAIIIFYAR